MDDAFEPMLTTVGVVAMKVGQYLQAVWAEYLSLSPLNQIVLVFSLPFAGAVYGVFRFLAKRTFRPGQTLPKLETGAKQPADPPPVGYPPRLREVRRPTPKVLIVDDDQEVLETARYALSAAGLDPHTAASADGGLDLFKKLLPNLVVLDGEIGDSSGPELLREMRKTANVPAILVTGFKEKYAEELVLQGGFDDYLLKPCKVSVLVARVLALLRRTAETHTA
jgi:CheY-like chemotaxis protein